MMKRSIALFLAAMLSLSLISCGSNQASDPSAAPDSTRTASEEGSATGAEDSAEDAQLPVSSDEDARTGDSAKTDASKEEDASAKTDDSSEETEGMQPLAVSRASHQEYAWDENWGSICQMKYELFSLGEDSAYDYPELAQAVDEYNAIEEEALSGEFTSLEAGARAQLSEVPDAFRMQVIERSIAVRRADEAALSVLLNTYYDYGGAHGGSQLAGVTFDTAGKILELSDVVKDTNALPALIEEQLRAHYDPTYFYEPEEFPAWIEENLSEIPWTLETNGVTFYFNEYVIAPYASGYEIVTVPFEGHEDLFAKEFLEIPEAWCREIAPHVPAYEDLDGDGEAEDIRIWREWDENQMGTGVHVAINDSDVFQAMEIMDLSPVLVHTKNGKNALYIAVESSYGYHLMLFELKADGAVYAGTREAYWHDLWTPGSESYYISQTVLTDPSDFMLDSPVNTVSYMSAYKHYKAGEDGFPVSMNEDYILNWPVELVLQQDFTFEEIDGDGNSIGECPVPAGSSVFWISSDGTTDAVFSYAGEDGKEKLIRTEVTLTEYETIIGDYTVWELFTFPEADYGEGNDWNPFIMQRQVLVDTDTIGGVVFLGYIDPNAPMYWDDPDYYQNFIKNAGYWDDFEFFSELTSDHFIASDWGNELYAIIPADPEATVEVYEWYIGEENGYVGERAQLLYSRNNGSPILLKVNQSDIMPSVLVVITNPDGRTIEWNPFISLMDGHVQTVSNLEYLYDFTLYPEG